MKRAISYLLMLLIVLGLLVTLSITTYLSTPPDSLGIPKIITVYPGMSFAEVASILEEEGIIRGVRRFSLLVRYYQATKKIKAGEYRLNTSMLPLDVMNTLVRGDVIEHPITIPEGYNIFQIADLFDSSNLADRETFLKKSMDPAFVSSLEIEGESVEGYLFPDTYKIPLYMKTEEIIKVMVLRFMDIYSRNYAERAKELGLTMKDVVILASIIEKETGTHSERPLISAVFQNRLKKKIRLQSDPTAVYGIVDFRGKVTSKHLKIDTPYNTYLHSGLPPGPIANPGEASLRAVFCPADVDYLYFVSKNDGTHHFSSSLREHNAAVWKYQRRKR